MCKSKFYVVESGMGADAPVPPLTPDPTWLDRHGASLRFASVQVSSIAVVLAVSVLARAWR